jgi:protein-S-isoprenylcysteine O-methyltransferase Ste14
MTAAIFAPSVLSSSSNRSSCARRRAIFWSSRSFSASSAASRPDAVWVASAPSGVRPAIPGSSRWYIARENIPDGGPDAIQNARVLRSMLMVIRHLLSIAALPFVMAVVVPVWLARRGGVRLAVGADITELVTQLAGLLLLGIGLVLFAASLRRFASEGKGTLAPWDPPRALVVRGPYRYVRNPMISGVVFTLFGEALLLLSRAHFTWAALFLLANLIYIPVLEEPQLADRFGAAYREYCRNVPRFVPRLRPWQPSEPAE